MVHRQQPSVALQPPPWAANEGRQIVKHRRLATKCQKKIMTLNRGLTASETEAPPSPLHRSLSTSAFHFERAVPDDERVSQLDHNSHGSSGAHNRHKDCTACPRSPESLDAVPEVLAATSASQPGPCAGHGGRALCGCHQRGIGGVRAGHVHVTRADGPVGARSH